MRGGVLGIFVVAAFLSGCASGPAGNVALTDNVKPSGSRLVIYRSSALGFAVMPNYAVDGRVIGGSQAAGFLSCDLPPGRHEVAVNNLPLSTNLFGQGSEKVSIDLRAGSTTYLSAQPQMGIITPGAITLVQVTEGAAPTSPACIRARDHAARDPGRFAATARMNRPADLTSRSLHSDRSVSALNIDFVKEI